MTPRHRIALIALACGTAAASCGRNWDDFDPRLEDSAAGTGGQTAGSGGAGGNGASGGAGGNGGNPQGRCGGIGVLANDFDDGQPNPLMTGAGQASDGALTMAVPAGSTAGHYGSYTYYEMTGRAVSLELVDVPLDAGFYFSLDTDSNDWVEFFIADGTLRAVRCQNNSCDIPASVTFDATAHRFVQLREQDNTIYYEVSEDGVAWQPFGSAPTLGAGELLTVNIGFFDETPSMMERQIVVDNLSAAPEAHCPANFDDDFNDELLHPRWASWEEESVELRERDGVLEVEMDPGVTFQGAAIETKSAFDVRGATITIEIVEGTDDEDPGQAWLTLHSPDDQGAVTLNPYAGTLYITEVNDGNSDSTTIPYDPQSMGWLRFREENGTFHFEVGPSATSSFTSVYSTQAPFDPTAIQILIGASGATSTGLMLSHEVCLDNFSARVP